MNYVELSLEELKNESKSFAERIKAVYMPDIIVYIAKGGFIIGKVFQNVFDVPLVGVDAVRQENKVKEALSSLLKRLPKSVLIFLRKIEVISGVHEKNEERNVKIHQSVSEVERDLIKKILIVDDSVDTGNSVKAVADEMEQLFPGAEIRIAALVVWDKSKGKINTDYFIYENSLLRSPMSKDSKEYKQFLEIYSKDTKEGYI